MFKSSKRTPALERIIMLTSRFTGLVEARR